MKSRIWIAAVGSGLLLAAVVATNAGGAGIDFSCELVAAGPDGPRGDVLRIDDGVQTATHIDAKNGEIVIYNNLSRDPAVCSGGTPTVTDIDSIEYRTQHGAPFIGYSGEAIGPGATPEAHGSEIEISVVEEDEDPFVAVGATKGDDTIQVGMLGKGKVGINLNAQADGAAQDADVTLKADPGSDAEVRAAGLEGNDEMTSLGGPAFTGPVKVGKLILDGGEGNDRLAGGPYRDLLIGDVGNDVLLGGRGADGLGIGPGRDIAKGGKGPDHITNSSSVGGIPDDLGRDLVFGGSGDDTVRVINELGGDQVDCGSGDADQVELEPDDHQRRCEKVDVEAL